MHINFYVNPFYVNFNNCLHLYLRLLLTLPCVRLFEFPVRKSNFHKYLEGFSVLTEIYFRVEETPVG